MAASDDVRNYQTGETGDPNNPYQQGWMSRVRARKVLSDNVDKLPFTRIWGAIKAVASPMQQDKLTAVADAVGWRRTNLEPEVPDVVDVGDMILIWWEYFKLTSDRATLLQAVANAQRFDKWPSGYVGVADFEVGT